MLTLAVSGSRAHTWGPECWRRAGARRADAENTPQGSKPSRRVVPPWPSGSQGDKESERTVLRRGARARGACGGAGQPHGSTSTLQEAGAETQWGHGQGLDDNWAALPKAGRADPGLAHPHQHPCRDPAALTALRGPSRAPRQCRKWRPRRVKYGLSSPCSAGRLVHCTEFCHRQPFRDKLCPLSSGLRTTGEAHEPLGVLCRLTCSLFSPSLSISLLKK